MDINEELFKYLFAHSEKPSEDKSTPWKRAANPTLKEFNSNEKTGKWCLVFSPQEIDDAWTKIHKATKDGKLLLAKCSTALGAMRFGTHLVCVYTTDWQDSEDIQKTRETLRTLGFTQPLKYKRDIETINRVYNTDNEYYIDETKDIAFNTKKYKI